MADDVIIKVMPKEFLGKETSLNEPAKSAPAPVPIIPVVQPIVPIPVPVAPQPLKPVTMPSPVSTPPSGAPIKKKSRLGLILIILILLLAAGSVGGYFYWQSLQVVTPEPIPEPIPTPEPTPEPEPTPIPEPLPVTPQPGRDTDSDGLTDVEEALYGTDARNPDTDADTFLDGNEVFHFYDPLNGQSSTLATSLKQYIMTDGSTFWYPTTWSVSESEGGVINIQTTTSEEFTLSRIKKDDPLRPQYETGHNDPAMSLRYLDGDDILIWEYNSNEATSIEYLTSFQMIAGKSFNFFGKR